MGNKLVIYIPLVVFLLTVSAATSIVAAQKGYAISLPESLKRILSSHNVPSPVNRYLPHTSPNEFIQTINQSRVKSGLAPLSHQNEICQDSEIQMEEDDIYNSCEQCSHAALIKISSRISQSRLLDYLVLDPSANQIIHNPKLTHICAKENDNMLTALVVAFRDTSITPAPQAPTQAPAVVRQSHPLEITNFSEEELWSALTQYRQTHKRSNLILDDKLCEYARKRVQDHLEDFETKEPDEYPVPGKYPLDAHSGFAADADSGYAFEATGKNRLAENLAYWPTADSATQIIEWGWDSSTEGHRETQLSNDYTHACISGQDGFYVAIFGG